MHKRILSIVLVLLMMCPCFALSVSADPLPEEELLKQTLKEAYIEYWTNDIENKEALKWFNGNLSHFGYLGEAGCHVFQAAALPGDPVEPTESIGNYRFTAYMCMGYCDTNPAGMYAYKDGEVMTLKEAYDKGLVDLDLLYEKTDEKSYTMTPLSEEEILKNKCRTEYMEEFGIATNDEDEVYVDFAVKFANYTVFRAHHLAPPQMGAFQYIDGYWFSTPCIWGNDDNPTGLYTLDNYGNVENLSRTYYKGYIDIDDIFEELSEKCEMYIHGDIDGDKRLTVKDATFIQKYIAKVPGVLDKVSVDSYLSKRIMDFDLTGGIEMFGDCGDVNIKDATYLQKKLAKIIEDDYDESFSYEEILVYVSTEDEVEFTLEDFPEYEFESVKKYEYSTDMYILKLKNPGKENVIDAVNSLKYREGVDIIKARLNTFILY